MNFLAHVYLADGDEGLMLGALLGDFIRGRQALRVLPPGVRRGVALHRRIDRITDHSRVVRQLRRAFPKEFRRYAGIIVDLAFDHELARRWPEFASVSLERYDSEIRALLARHRALLPDGLKRFMRYADSRGLFAAYRDENELLFSLAGIGTRLKRDNPLHRVGEVWPELRLPLREGFARFFPVLQSAVAGWRKRRSTSTGS
jgi:acyl carrier protein phosphodiesterase